MQQSRLWRLQGHLSPVNCREYLLLHHPEPTNHTEVNLPDDQDGYRPGWSMVDMIFMVRYVQEKCREQNLDL